MFFELFILKEVTDRANLFKANLSSNYRKRVDKILSGIYNEFRNTGRSQFTPSFFKFQVKSNGVNQERNQFPF